jgi:hypothetical protein
MSAIDEHQPWARQVLTIYGVVVFIVMLAMKALERSDKRLVPSFRNARELFVTSSSHSSSRICTSRLAANRRSEVV